ncbi:MAG TPA: rhomboid family intramembrane serine protease [Polyangiales bacterium]|nr:rhomboid family intramembrane serine protease [Polyangiales bacterium]
MLLNAALFIYQSTLAPDELSRLIAQHGLTPALLLEPHGIDVVLSPLTSMFMHGSWAHLLVNLWFLLIFGHNVEALLGKSRMLLLYIASGLAAGAAQVLVDPQSEVPMLGASGAIAGLLACYVKLFPQGRVLSLVPVIFVFVQELPAMFYVAFWFVLQVLGGFASLTGPSAPGIAFFANIGGFVMGMWAAGWIRPARNATGGFRRPEYY